MAGNQLNNVMLLDLITGLPRTPEVGGTPDTIQLETDFQLLSGANMLVDGNLVVNGTTTTIHSEAVNIRDNHLYLNADYTTAVAQTGGLVVNVLPTATADTVAATGFVAGDAGVSNPTVITVGTATFSAGDIVQVSGADDQQNDGIYEVESHTGTTLTIRGIGTSATTQDWVQNDFVTDTTVAGAITLVNVNVLRGDSSGDWETATTTTTTALTYNTVTVQGVVDLQEAYEQGNTITTDGGNGNVIIAGTELISITATGGLDLNTIFDFDGTSFDVQMTGSNGFSLDGTAASNVTVNAGDLTVETTASGSVLVDGVGGVEVNSSSGAINIGNDGNTGAINIGTGAAVRTITVGNASGATAVDFDSGTGAFSFDSTVSETVAIATYTTSGSGGDTFEVFVGGLDPTAAAGVVAPVGSLYHRDVGNAGTSGEIYIKTGAGATDWTPIGTGAGNSLQQAYVVGNTIVTDSTNGDFDVSGTEAISLDASAASNFTVAGAALTLSTTTSGNVDVTAADAVNLTAGDEAAAAGNNVTVASGSATGGTGAGGEIDLTAGDGFTTGTGGAVDINAGSGGGTDASVGGAVTINAGTSTATNGDGGDVTVAGGAGTGTGVAGDVNLLTTGAGEVDITAGGLMDLNAGANLDIDVTGSFDMLATTTFSIDGTGASNVTATTGGLTLSTATSGTLLLSSAALVDIDAAANLDVDVTGTMDFLSTGAFSIDGTGASNVTATSGDLTVSTLTSGDLLLSSVAEVDIASGTTVDINATTTVTVDTADAADASGNDITLTAGSSTGGTADGASIILTPGDGFSTGVAGDLTVTGPNDEDEAIITLATTGTNGDSINMFVGDSDPSGAVTGLAGSLFFRDTGTTGELYLNTSTASGTSWEQVATGDTTETLQEAYEAGNTIVTDSTNGDFDVSGTEAISLDASTASNFSVASANLTIETTTSGELDLTSAGLMDVNAGANLDIDVTGTYDMLSTGVFSIDGTGASNVTATSGDLTVSTLTTGSVLVDGIDGVEINSSSGAISIGNDGDTGAINIGTGAAVRTITMGNATGATAVNFDSGTGGFTFDSTVSGAVAFAVVTTSGAAGDSVEWYVSDTDPSAAAGIAAPVGSTLWRDAAGAGTTGELWLKIGAADTAWEQVATGDTTETLQEAYEAGNTIVTDSTNGDFDVSGTEAISLDASAASNFSVASANLTLETTTSGTVDINSAADITLTFATANTTAMVIDDGSNTYLTIDSTVAEPAVAVEQFLDIVGSGAGITLTAGEALTAGQVVTIEATSGDAILADSNTSTTLDGLAVGVAVFASTDATPVKVYTVAGSLIPINFASAPAAASNGSPVFVSPTAGEATLTAPTGSGNVVYLLGILQGADGADTSPMVLFQPQFISVRP